MWGLSILAVVLIAISMVIDETDVESRKNHWIRTAIILSGLLSVGIGYVLKENLTQRHRIILDAEDISASSRQQRYYEVTKPESESAVITLPKSPWEPNLFDWTKLISEANKYPHLLFLGSTGDGKTTLAEWLHEQMGGERVAIHPHWQDSNDPLDPPDFAYANHVIGGGRDFEAISTYISNLHSAMNFRSKLSKDELKRKRTTSTLIDELPAVAKNCGTKAIEQIISLIFEARKFRIRLMLLAQADSVKILGLEGQGAVRDNLTYIRLGDYAIDHARWLINKKLAELDLLEWLENQTRPCMVEDQPAEVPFISKRGVRNGYQFDRSDPSFYIYPDSLENAPTFSKNGVGDLQLSNQPPTESPTPFNSLQDKSLDYLKMGLSNLQQEAYFDPTDLDISPQEYAVGEHLILEGKGQLEVIEVLYGVKPSGTDKRYQMARQKYQAIAQIVALQQEQERTPDQTGNG